MRRLYAFGAVGILGSIIAGSLYYFASSGSPIVFIASESFKAFLTFTLIALGGALIKEAVDASLDKQRRDRTIADQREERRSGIIREFIEIFSEFYSVRKLYHSARSQHQIYDRSGNDYAVLIKDMLKKSIELEGRYGALKILAINHLGLSQANLITKSTTELKDHIRDLKISINSPEDTRALIRDQLDLLGELYDEWRHSLEKDKDISVAIGREVWENYEALLKFLVAVDALMYPEAPRRSVIHRLRGVVS